MHMRHRLEANVCTCGTDWRPVRSAITPATNGIGKGRETGCIELEVTAVSQHANNVNET